LKEGDTFIIVRFAAFDAVHDVGQKGFKSVQERIDIVRQLESFGRVFVTSEVRIPELAGNTLKLPPERMHNLLAFASLYVGEGATMASEAGVLGVPWIFVYSLRLPYLDDQETRYGLGHTVDGAAQALELAKGFLRNPTLKSEWQAKRQRLLRDKIDVSTFMTNLIVSTARAA
jgi:predicted glycosyltransferase